MWLLCVGARCWMTMKAMPGSLRQGAEELLQRRQPAGGRADAHHVELGAAGGQLLGRLFGLGFGRLLLHLLGGFLGLFLDGLRLPSLFVSALGLSRAHAVPLNRKL